MPDENEQQSGHNPGSVNHNDEHKTEKLAGSKEAGTDMSSGGAGEDEGSAPVEGDDSHLKEDQKPITH